LVGPSAAKNWPYATPSARTYAASNKKGNAILGNISDITPEVVAGLVCQVRPVVCISDKCILIHHEATFALSDAGSWKDKIGDIDLIELYTNTVQILRVDVKWVDKTLDTLQSYVQTFVPSCCLLILGSVGSSGKSRRRKRRFSCPLEGEIRNACTADGGR
jgi:hypothetical protein